MKELFRIRGFVAYLVMIFINAFVDLGHKIIIQNTVFKMYDGQTQVILTAIINGLILLPFIVLFSPAGFLSDKYPKTQVMRHSALAAVIVTLMITFAYYQGWFWVAFMLTLGMGIQSALYSPAKYGYLKELVGDAHLGQGNGVIQALTIVSILAGTFVFSALFEILLKDRVLDSTTTIMQGIAVLGWVLVALSLWEWWLAHRLTQTRTRDESKRFSLGDYLRGNYLKRNLKAISSRRAIWLSIMGLSMFWSVSQVVLAAFPAFAKEVLQENNTLVIQGILACTGIGIVIGSLLAGRISRNYIELGLIPVGALGFAFGLGLIPLLDTRIGMAVMFIFLGLLGGMFIVPLNSLIQYHAKESELGTVLAGNNWVQNIAMLGFLGTTVVLASLGMSSVQLFYVVMVVAIVGALYTVYELPHSLVRIAASVLIRHRYRIDVLGFERLPKSGGVLLLGNHVSWIDWAMIQIACPRPVRFVMLRSIYNQWYLNPVLKFFGTIPISPGSSRESLEQVNAKLKAGEVVCLFPEGAISRTGGLGLFHAGYERAVEGVEGTIVPFYLHGLWGSSLSRANSEKLRRNTSRGLRRGITVCFGKALSMDTKAAEIKQKIFELSYEAWEFQAERFDSLPLAWIRTTQQQLHHEAVIGSDEVSFTYAKLLAVTTAFSRLMKTEQQNVGLLLPASSAAIIANMAVMLKGKTAVNLNYSTSISAVQSALNNAEIDTVFASEKFLQKLQQRGIDTEAMLKGIKVVMLEDLKEQLSKPFLLMAWALVYVLPATIFYRLFGKPVRAEDPAAILFSSGSEGVPKGIVLSHRNFISNIKQISDVLKTRDDDVVMGSLPPFHSFGLTVTTFLPLIEGITVVCHPDPTDVLNIAKGVFRHKVTILCATATFLRLYTRNKKVHPLMLDSLRITVAGAEKLPVDVRQEFHEKFGKVIYEGYGATETTPVASVNIPDELDQNDWRVQVGHKLGTVGMPLPGCSFRIVDPNSLIALPAGEDGLILISGTQVMMGYLKDPEKTANAIIEIEGRRWYKTGDKGHLDEDGFLTIVDRYSRFAKIGGEMISLGAVEAEVRKVIVEADIELLAVNIPDEKKGEQVILLTTAFTTIDQLRKDLLAINCNPLMIPSAIYQVEAVPKLGSGKTDFSAAKNMAIQLTK